MVEHIDVTRNRLICQKGKKQCLTPGFRSQSHHFGSTLNICLIIHENYTMELNFI